MRHSPLATAGAGILGLFTAQTSMYTCNSRSELRRALGRSLELEIQQERRNIERRVGRRNEVVGSWQMTPSQVKIAGCGGADIRNIRSKYPGSWPDGLNLELNDGSEIYIQPSGECRVLSYFIAYRFDYHLGKLTKRSACRLVREAKMIWPSCSALTLITFPLMPDYCPRPDAHEHLTGLFTRDCTQTQQAGSTTPGLRETCKQQISPAAGQQRRVPFQQKWGFVRSSSSCFGMRDTLRYVTASQWP